MEKRKQVAIDSDDDDVADGNYSDSDGVSDVKALFYKNMHAYSVRVTTRYSTCNKHIY